MDSRFCAKTGFPETEMPSASRRMAMVVPPWPVILNKVDQREAQWRICLVGGGSMSWRSFSRSFRSLLQDDMAFGYSSWATGVADDGARHFWRIELLKLYLAIHLKPMLIPLWNLSYLYFHFLLCYWSLVRAPRRNHLREPPLIFRLWMCRHTSTIWLAMIWMVAKREQLKRQKLRTI